MNPGLKRAWPRIRDRLLGVPIVVKILGIGLATVAVFAGLFYLQASRVLTLRLYQMLERQARSGALALAADIRPALIRNDTLTLEDQLKRTMALAPDLRYVIVRGADGTARFDTFPRGLPTALRSAPVNGFRMLQYGHGRILEVSVPLLPHGGGLLQYGMTDRSVRNGLRSLNRALVEALLLGAFLGLLLALVLARVITRPLRALLLATETVGRGDVRAALPKSFGDEIGRLTLSFRRMSGRLARYRRRVAEKEKARRALTERLLRSQEEERAAVSRELHDQLGQSLSACLLRLRAMGADGRLDSAARDELEGMVQGLLGEVRQLAWQMRPSVLDDSGLELALRRLAERTEARGGLAVDYQYLSDGRSERLPADVEAALYRVAQEALTNVERHAGATEVSLLVVAEAGSARLVVEDDGQGLRDGDPEPGHGLGIVGMRERIEALNGTFSVEFTPGRGTTVAARIHWE